RVGRLHEYQGPPPPLIETPPTTQPPPRRSTRRSTTVVDSSNVVPTVIGPITANVHYYADEHQVDDLDDFY
ncbi:hypothetical protein F443_01121, partial [Phytophthora nicotianae P1569]